MHTFTHNAVDKAKYFSLISFFFISFVNSMCVLFLIPFFFSFTFTNFLHMDADEWLNKWIGKWTDGIGMDGLINIYTLQTHTHAYVYCTQWIWIWKLYMHTYVHIYCILVVMKMVVALLLLLLWNCNMPITHISMVQAYATQTSNTCNIVTALWAGNSWMLLENEKNTMKIY